MHSLVTHKYLLTSPQDSSKDPTHTHLQLRLNQQFKVTLMQTWHWKESYQIITILPIEFSLLINLLLIICKHILKHSMLTTNIFFWVQKVESVHSLEAINITMISLIALVLSRVLSILIKTYLECKKLELSILIINAQMIQSVFSKIVLKTQIVFLYFQDSSYRTMKCILLLVEN